MGGIISTERGNNNRRANTETGEERTVARQPTGQRRGRGARQIASSTVIQDIEKINNSEDTLIGNGLALSEDLREFRDDARCHNCYNEIMLNRLDEVMSLLKKGVSFKELYKLCKVDKGTSLNSVLDRVHKTSRLLELAVTFDDITNLAKTGRWEVEEMLKGNNEEWVQSNMLNNSSAAAAIDGLGSGSLAILEKLSASNVVKYLEPNERRGLLKLSGSGYKAGAAEWHSTKKSYASEITKRRQEAAEENHR